MPYQTGNATNYKDLLDKLRQFICGYATYATPVYTGTGNGTMVDIETYPDSPSETWTVLCTAESPDGGTFSVTGSVSGAQAAATVGTPYDNGIVKFTIEDGSIDFVIGDQFTLDVTEGDMTVEGQAWEEQRWVAEDELIVKGPGLAGLDEIFVGIKTYESVGGDYYNWKLAGFTGFNSGLDFDNQPGITTGTLPRVCLFNSTIPYWIVASGRRFCLIAKISTVYEALYMGFLQPYATPGQYPYPLVIGGSSTVFSGERWSVESGDHRQFVDPGGSTVDRTALRLREPSGTWAAYRHRTHTELLDSYASRCVFPYYGLNGPTALVRPDKWREGLDGTYPMLPLVLHADDPDTNTFGELEGCFWVSGYGNAVENIVNIGSDQYLVVQNVFRTTTGAYWAMKLE